MAITRRAALVAGGAAALVPGGAPSPRELQELLRTVDDRQRNSGDFRALAQMEQKSRDQVDIVYEVLFYRRSRDRKFLMLFTRPKASEGQGYLRLDDNMWFYDPKVGNWERRTERERLGGTNSRRSDFDESRLALEYTPEYAGEESLGAYRTVVLLLKGQPGLDLAFPTVRLWVDKETRNVLKRQEFALSGKLLRTSYYPRWHRLHSASKGGDVWYPRELRFFDEVERANQTSIVVKSVNLEALEPNLFTKAWLEARSR